MQLAKFLLFVPAVTPRVPAIHICMLVQGVSIGKLERQKNLNENAFFGQESVQNPQNAFFGQNVFCHPSFPSAQGTLQGAQEAPKHHHTPFMPPATGAPRD